LGSSLTVSPANDLPSKVVKKSGQVVIVNLQRTPLDTLSTLRIHGRTDEVMQGVMRELGLDIPPFILQRRLRVKHTKEHLTLEAIDVDGTPLSLFSSIQVQFLPSGQVHELKAESVLGRVETAFTYTHAPEDTDAKIELRFVGHYDEPDLPFNYKLEEESSSKRFLLSLDFTEGAWSVEVDQVGSELGMDPQPGPSQWPKKAHDPRHKHSLTLLQFAYEGVYRCNECMRPGVGWVYHCKQCSFDLHPHCCHKE